MRRTAILAALCAALALGAVLAQAQTPPPGPAQGPPPAAAPPGGFNPGFGPGGGQGGRGGGRGGGPPLTAEQLTALKASYAAPTSTPFPADNPPTPEKLALGQKLFFDPVLSANGRLACASCHDARHAFTDARPLSLGVKSTSLNRHTPSAINLAWSPALFWDGRANSLEAQAVMPIANEDEMGMPHAVMAASLAADPAYGRMFAAAFPGQAVGADTVGKAIAVFERSLTFTNSPFDRWIAGDESAISDAAKRGFAQFNTGGCAQCHSGWNFTDNAFHDIGLATSDTGRFGVNNEEAGRFAFKTPSLRNIADQAPYMHTGGFVSLQQVLRFYNNGFIRRPTLAPEMRNVRAGRGGGDIIAFLQTLSSPMPAELIEAQDYLDRSAARPAQVAAR